jgi:hypothetical protein
MHGPNIKHRFQQYMYCRAGVFASPLHRNESSTVACALIPAGACLPSSCRVTARCILAKCTTTAYTCYNTFLPSLIHGAEPFLRSRQLCSYSRSSQHFMEPECSSPCSKEPSTGPYPFFPIRIIVICSS